MTELSVAITFSLEWKCKNIRGFGQIKSAEIYYKEISPF